MKKGLILLTVLFSLSIILSSCEDEEQTISCTDGIQNGTETGIDCGGDCSPCSIAPTNTFYLKANFNGVNEEYGYSSWQNGILDDIVWERSPGECAYRFGSQTSYSKFVNLIFYKDLSCSSSYPDLNDRRGYLSTGTYNFGTGDGEFLLEHNPDFVTYYYSDGDQTGSSIIINSISPIESSEYFIIEGTINCVLRDGSDEITVTNGEFYLVMK